MNMADNDLCDDFKFTDNIDGRLLINRTLEGEPLAKIEDEIPFSGRISILGSQALPYLRCTFIQTWKAKEASIFPVRSILGLAPAEEITFDTRIEVQYDFGSVITNTQEFSSTYDNSYRETTETTGSTSTSQTHTTTDTDGIDLGPLGHWGGGGATVNVIEDMMTRTSSTLSDILRSASFTQTNGKSVEVTSSTQVLTQNSVTRHIRNPYHDRSLELRFHPVFRRFEVLTRFNSFDFGVIMVPGAIKIPPKMMTMHGDFLDKTFKDRNVLNVALGQLNQPQPDVVGATTRRRSRAAAAQAVSEPLQDHLDANVEYYTANFAQQVKNEGGREPIINMVSQSLSSMQRTSMENAFAYDKLKTYGNRVMVPAKNPDIFATAVNPPGWQVNELLQNVNTFRNKFSFTQDVNLFIGTHVEAVAGSCKLDDVPRPQ